MTASEHTTAKLARALEAIPGVPPDMIERARNGHYHDYMSPLDFPETQLVADLRELAARPGTPRNSRPMLRDLAKAVINGEHDASREESEAWARSAEGQETMAAVTGQTPEPRGYITPEDTVPDAFRKRPTPIRYGPASDTPDGDSVKACADLVGRTGATAFEFGYVHEDVPVAEAGWWATAVYKGVKRTAEDKASPDEACDALADILLTGAQCQHCKGLVALADDGAFAYRSAFLATGHRWDAEDAAKAPQCRWARTGARWERGCK
jgi:hypothetical protein